MLRKTNILQYGGFNSHKQNLEQLSELVQNLMEITFKRLIFSYKYSHDSYIMLLKADSIDLKDHIY